MCKPHFKQESRCTHPRFITVWGTLTFSVKIKAQNDKLTAKKKQQQQHKTIQFNHCIVPPFLSTIC